MSETPDMSHEPIEVNLPAVANALRLPAEYQPLAGIGMSDTNLPLSDPDGARIHTQALNGDHPALADNVNLEFNLYAYAIHPYQGIDDKTGEVYVRNRLVIVTHEGNFYQSGGFYTEESLARIMRSNGRGPWHPPIRVKVTSAPNKHGGRVYKLVPVSEASARMPWQAQPQQEKKRAK